MTNFQVRRVFSWRLGVTIALATLLAITFTLARVGAEPGAVTIARVTLSADGSTLFIYGDQFGAAPIVSVGGARALDIVVDSTGTAITAAMPAGLAPGMYQVHVDRPAPACVDSPKRPGLRVAIVAGRETPCDATATGSRAMFFVNVPGDGQSGVQGPQGLTGAPGVMSSEKIAPTPETSVSSVSFIGPWTGVYSGTDTYAIGELVFHPPTGSTYISLQRANFNRQPDTNPTWWSLLAQRGGTA